MSEIIDKHNNATTGIDVVLSVLESGHSVELPATGYSMFPALRPGDRAVVNPLQKGALAVVGSVIVCMAEGGWRKPHTSRLMPHNVLVMHRLVEIKKDDSGNFLLITRGDSMSDSDLPWHQDQIIGLVNSFTRDGSKYQIKNRIPHEMEYKINRVLLWLRIKLTTANRMPFTSRSLSKAKSGQAPHLF